MSVLTLTDQYIGGKWIPSTSTETVDVLNPATEEVIAVIPGGGAADIDAAVAAARSAARAWGASHKDYRLEFLGRLVAKLAEAQPEIVETVVAELGCPVGFATAVQAALPLGVAESYLRILADYEFEEQVGNSTVYHEPAGVVGAITPWNYPLHQIVAKVMPALAAGCVVVLKPAEDTPLTARLFARLVDEAGFPAGVFNLVTGTGLAAGAALAAHPDVDMLSFTGSTAVGRRLLELCAPRVISTSMELGGNSPLVVLPDADLDVAIAGAMAAKMRNGGEACTAANRFLVHESIANAFTDRLTEAMAAVTVAEGFADGAQLGPLINEAARDKVERLVADAVARGARVRTGGERLPGPGYFYPPTVLDRVQRGSAILAEEVFGPVAPVMTFATEDEAVELANDTEHGLVAFVCSRDLRRALALGERIETGMVGLNRGVVSDPAAPFGGTKQSGLGREGGHHGLLEFLEPKYFAFD